MKRIISIILVLSLLLLFPLNIFAESETSAGEENTMEKITTVKSGDTLPVAPRSVLLLKSV